ncbi:heat-inducible transcriptional repressor [Microbacteriaceae bacterium SG_E_30_P1]|uniref:Heat-inducible transcription repressor HrcA n=1 Tax=Antiquaquibacter oligotrophicus TaxID=2880260 RepID=A0ABT6KNW4_9MICO|nr:heat-inducible transcriptional repressor HrcA [Antiquaquibacter oligotrophicus]MDH6181148.1 heat-inducible transcriptional repressor [Antiquaquibacter oligotrophicus]UDF13156.1 heat-inducible transcriptional repressor HrcA [Antiquaquibacter oligotrophicus]
MVSERGLEVLRVIVQDYVASREPVGSKSIVDRHSFGVSAATIRNDMALLEDEELISAPHTSSGRVPTDKGYRVFVDQLADVRPLTSAQRHAIETFLGQSADLDDVLARTVRLLSQLTNQVALVQYPSLATSRIRHIEIVQLTPSRVMSVLITDSGRVEQRLLDLSAPMPEDDLVGLRSRLNSVLVGLALPDAAAKLSALAEDYPADRRTLVSEVTTSLVEQVLANRQDKLVMAGAANLARTEQDFTGSIYPVLEAIEEQVTLLRLFGEMEVDAGGVSARIGRENEGFGLAETSVVTSGYSSSGGSIARLGVLGPTRMDYSNNMAAVRAVARYLSRLLDED